jgi:hypothetical protein
MPRVSPFKKGYKPVHGTTGFKSEKKPEDLIVLPAYERYLTKYPELTENRQAVERVVRELLTPPRNRSRSFSASSAGYCLRRQELAFLGVKQNPMNNPRLARIFGNGTMVHLRWQIGLLSARIVDDIEYTVTSNSGLARATLDGIGVAMEGNYKGARFVWEHKGRMSFSFLSQTRKGEPDDKTFSQVKFQFLQTGYDIAAVTNENKDTQEVDEFVIERTDEMVADAKKELRELILAVDKQRLHPMLPECQRQLKSGEFMKCPFGTTAGACLHTGSWPR